MITNRKPIFLLLLLCIALNPFMAQGTDTAINIDVESTIDGKTYVIPLSGVVTQDDSLKDVLYLEADLINVTSDLTSILKKKIEAENSCEMRFFVHESNLSVKAPNAEVSIDMDFEFWLCAGNFTSKILQARLEVVTDVVPMITKEQIIGHISIKDIRGIENGTFKEQIKAYMNERISEHNLAIKFIDKLPIVLNTDEQASIAFLTNTAGNPALGIKTAVPSDSEALYEYLNQEVGK